ncbi:MAG: hypothetical protein JSC189_000706 [Candidatus Tokpelaia sp. JSC189]|nr:MAG: hypothetical protein JSC189_000706 [Candidatus Tokpelaia sp. JSC189]
MTIILYMYEKGSQFIQSEEKEIFETDVIESYEISIGENIYKCIFDVETGKIIFRLFLRKLF